MQSKVSIGPTTVLGGGVTLAAFALAVVAFARGARDEATISAVVIGGLGLVSTLWGRYWQAAAHAKKLPPLSTPVVASSSAATTPHRVAMLWYPKAERAFIPGQDGLTPLKGRPKIVLHTTEGSTIAGAESAYRSSGGSAPHFTISPENVHQHIPLNKCSYSLKHPPGTPETNRAGLVIQIEQVGFAADTATWPDSYYARVSELVAWIHENAGVPRQQISNGIHADFTNPMRIPEDEWADWSGVCGHVHVPNNDHVDPGRGYHIGKVLP